MPSFLRDLKRGESGFKVPADYFGTLEDSVFQKIEAREHQPKAAMKALHGVGMRTRFFQPKYVVAVAASIALAIGAWWFMRPAPEFSPVAVELSAEDVEAYVLDNIRDFDSEQLVVLCEDNTLPEVSDSPNPSQQRVQKRGTEDISPEDVEDLLKDMSDEELEQLL